MKYNRPTQLSHQYIRVNQYILNELQSVCNKLTLNKKELACILNISAKTISNSLHSGRLPIRYIKLGDNMQSSIRFPLISVAKYLTNELCIDNFDEEYRNTSSDVATFFLDIEVGEYLFNELKNKYHRIYITKKELAHELSLSPKTISNRMGLKTFPIKHIKEKKTQQAPVKFSVLAVKEFMIKELFISELYQRNI